MRGVLRRAAFNAAPVVGMAVVDAEGRFTQAVGRIAKVAVPAPDPVAGTISIGIITADGLIPVWRGLYDRSDAGIGNIVAFLEPLALGHLTVRLALGQNVLPALVPEHGGLLVPPPH